MYIWNRWQCLNLVYISKLPNDCPDFPMYPVASLTSTSKLCKGNVACLTWPFSSSLPPPSPISLYLSQRMQQPVCFPVLSTVSPIPSKGLRIHLLPPSYLGAVTTAPWANAIGSCGGWRCETWLGGEPRKMVKHFWVCLWECFWKRLAFDSVD